MTKRKMTKDENKKIYQIVKQACDGDKAYEEASAIVETITDRPYGFASYYKALEAMRVGGKYEKSIGAELTRCFLETILEEDGTGELKIALDAFKAHIEHRQKHDSSYKMKDYIPIYNEFRAKL